MSFAKLDSSFAGSSLLAQGGLELAGFWAVLLSKKDGAGQIHDSLPKLAHDCYTTKERVTELLEVLASPDPDSRTPDYEGRRVQVDREPRWCVTVLNHERYTEKDPTAAERMRRFRAKQRGVTDVTPVTPVTDRSSISTSLSDVVSGSESVEGGVGGDPRSPEDQVRGSNFRAAADLDVQILRACREISEKAGMPAWKVMRQVTKYNKRDGTVSAGVEDPSRLGSVLAREKALEDARAWIAHLDAGGSAA